MLKWTSDRNASPPMHYQLKAGRKQVALVRRVSGSWAINRKGQRVYRHRYQLVSRWVDGTLGGAIGPIFKTITAAKRAAETRVKGN